MILNKHERSQRPNVLKAQQARDDADQRLETFLTGCAPYQVLKRDVVAKNRALYRVQQQDRDASRKARTNCVNAVRLNGPTPAVVKMIKAFLKKFP